MPHDLMNRSHPFLRLISAGAVVWAACGPVLIAGDQPGSTGVETVAQAEVVRRAEAARAADATIIEARGMAAAGKTTEALAALAGVRAGLPESPITLPTRAAARDAFASIAITEAGHLATEGKYDEARVMLARVLDPGMDPENKPARKLQKDLEDPDRFSPAASPIQGDKVAYVEDKLRLAESFVQLADYDKANRTYEDVLRVDKYNMAARAGMETVERAITGYADTAYNHTRAKMLAAVDKEWASPVPRLKVPTEESMDTAGDGSLEVEARNRRELLTRKMQNIKVDSIAIEGVSIREAIQAVVAKSKAMDKDAANPGNRGVNLLLDIGADSEPFAKAVLAREIQLRLSDVPLSAVIEYLAKEAGLGVRVEPFAVLLVPPGDVDTYLFSRSYNVPPDFIATVPTDAAAAGNDPFAAGNANASGGLSLKRLSPQEFLTQAGITFPKNAFALFDTRTSTLSMRNTATNHDVLDAMVQKARTTLTPQVTIEVKMIEVQENVVHELGFDWLLGAFGVNNGVAVAGGTGPDMIADNTFPIQDPVTGNPVGENPVTAGNRSGDTALTTRTMDRLLSTGSVYNRPTSSSRAPAILSMAGVLSEPRFQTVIRALSQDKGTDFLNSPMVTTRSGLPAKIEVIRDFIYPTEYDPPKLPNSVGQNFNNNNNDNNNNNNNGGGGNNLINPVTPANPSAFETKPVGSMLEVEPVVSADSSVVEVNVDATYREFIGFVNYGTPITGFAADDPNSQVLLTPNRILQPVFETRHIKTSTSVYDGQTIMIGGLLNDAGEHVEDKVPLLGDVPLIGRFFKSQVNENDRRVLLIFLTVNALDPSGRPVRETYQAAAPQE